jgi:hypothetical protein
MKKASRQLANLVLRSGASPKGRSGRQTKSGASGPKFSSGEHVPDRVAKAAADVDLGDFGAALLSSSSWLS